MITMQLKLSIIIPCYNCKKTLQEAVASCYTQGFSNEEFEIVMVNDGSTDDTWKVMQTIVKKNKNIHIFQHKENMGGGATRNTAISNAHADCFFCLDSDDILPAGTLQRMYNFLQEKKADVVTLHKIKKFSNNNPHQIIRTDIFPYPGKKLDYECLIQRNDALCPLLMVTMFTKNTFKKTGGFPTQHGFDTQGFGWRVLAKNLSAWECPEAIYKQRINTGNSYYLREYKQGLANYNLQAILAEHADILNTNILKKLIDFDYSDFTHPVTNILKSVNDVFMVEPQTIERQQLIKQFRQLATKPKTLISFWSLRGILLRLKTRLRSLPIKTKHYIRRIIRPASLFPFSRRTYPLSDYYGFDRGTPIDRFYIENFLSQHSNKVRGKVLELLNDHYTKKYGGVNVITNDILDIDKTNAKATIFDDLRTLEKIADETYDCIILTQVLQFIDDFDVAIKQCHRVLKPGGVLLATVPALSRVDVASGLEGDYWRFTATGAKYAFSKHFRNLTITSRGNCRTGRYFWCGYAQEDVSVHHFSVDDPNFPVIITICAQK